MPQLITTLGPMNQDGLDLILPHEHVFTDLRTPDTPGHGEAELEKVLALMAPQLTEARHSGIGAIVECTPVGVGRRADLLKAVSEAADLPLVVPTGIYREPWVPDWAYRTNEDDLSRWMEGELKGEIEGSGVQAGFIKLSSGDDGFTSVEQKILRAAAKASCMTGSVIASHTIRGDVVFQQLRLLEDLGVPPDRFIWVHAIAEQEFGLNLEFARRGGWVEYDWIGGTEIDDDTTGRVLRLLDEGLEDHILLSQDRGWYDPSQPTGGDPKSYTYLVEHYLPQLEEAGVDGTTIQKLTCHNPFRAFAR